QKEAEVARKEAERQAKEKTKQEEAARKEAEKLAKEKAKQEEEEWKEAERLSKERAKQEQKEAEVARKEAERQAKEKAKQEEAARKEAEKLAEDKTKQKEPVAPTLYQGRVKLVVESPVDLGKLAQMQASLNNVDGLQLVMVGGSAGAAQIIVSVEKPLSLLNILEAIPVIVGVVKKNKEIMVTLKAE
ncbi:MAG: hypothetical protein ABUK06_04690, partial [Dehalococcoidales bacterium]